LETQHLHVTARPTSSLITKPQINTNFILPLSTKTEPKYSNEPNNAHNLFPPWNHLVFLFVYASIVMEYMGRGWRTISNSFLLTLVPLKGYFWIKLFILNNF
jgi:hypothetical protein